jgi:hypothetical protein
LLHLGRPAADRHGQHHKSQKSNFSQGFHDSSPFLYTVQAV